MPTMPERLAEQSCVPCRGGVPSLAPIEARAFLAQVPDWEMRDGGQRIVRHFSFKNFAQALVFVNQVSALAEAEQHHPDLSFGWGYATVSLHTHAIKGLHSNDFVLAAKIDRMVAETQVSGA